MDFNEVSGCGDNELRKRRAHFGDSGLRSDFDLRSPKDQSHGPLIIKQPLKLCNRVLLLLLILYNGCKSQYEGNRPVGGALHSPIAFILS